jgi:DNA-binding response OmpR family regulator
MARILLIEDDSDLRLAVRTMLTQAGHDVTEAADGARGLEQFRADHFDLVVTDIIMPDKEGIQTIREIRELDPGARILAISGGTQVYLTMARHLGACGALAKPFRRAELVEMVARCLSGARSGAA